MADKFVCSKPHVVVAVFILKNGKILIGKRLSSLGYGTWCIPGGRMELGEEINECAEREVLEETGIKIKNLRFGTVVNDYSIEEGWHYTSICLVADYSSGIVRVMEPEKCAEWRWVEWDRLPKPLFISMQSIIKQKFNPIKK